MGCAVTQVSEPLIPNQQISPHLRSCWADVWPWAWRRPSSHALLSQPGPWTLMSPPPRLSLHLNKSLEAWPSLGDQVVGPHSEGPTPSVMAPEGTANIWKPHFSCVPMRVSSVPAGTEARAFHGCWHPWQSLRAQHPLSPGLEGQASRGAGKDPHLPLTPLQEAHQRPSAGAGGAATQEVVPQQGSLRKQAGNSVHQSRCKDLRPLYFPKSD